MKILIWHVHGSWTTAFVQGGHEYLLPTLPDRGPDGRGRARTWDWPDSAVEVTPEEAADAEIDVVVMQRPEELDGLAEHPRSVAGTKGAYRAATCRRSTWSTPRRRGESAR